MADPNTGIWGEKEVNKGYRCDYLLAGAIGCCFNPKYVADLGCGIGHYTKIFKSFGWYCVAGFEGSLEAIDKNEEFCINYLDLSNRISDNHLFKMEYDLIICLEVGEHIPKKREQIFLDNICLKFVCKDLVLSWAIPGQKGRGHVNEQPNEYIISEVEKRNFSFDPKITKFLRKHSTAKWFRNTIMVFHKNEDIITSA